MIFHFHFERVSQWKCSSKIMWLSYLQKLENNSILRWNGRQREIKNRIKYLLLLLMKSKKESALKASRIRMFSPGDYANLPSILKLLKRLNSSESSYFSTLTLDEVRMMKKPFLLCSSKALSPGFQRPWWWKKVACLWKEALACHCSSPTVSLSCTYRK